MVGIVDQLRIASEHAAAIISEIQTHTDPIERRALLGAYHFALDRAYSKARLDVALQNEERAKSEKVAPARKFSVIRGGK
jgi:hypothetical protein